MMKSADLEKISDFTAACMKKSGLEIMTVLDQIPKGKLMEKSFVHKLGYFSRYENIKGGILEFDPDRYESGKGKIYFSDGKPFVSVKLSLWHPSGNADEVTQQWLEEQAETVNSFESDITSQNGYSVINIHPWTVDADDLAFFVSKLNDNIQIVSANELIALISKNVVQ